VSNVSWWHAFSAMTVTLLVGRQEGYPSASEVTT